MIRSTSAHCQAKQLQDSRRAEEDFLDWCDNQARHPAETRMVDRAFCTSWMALTLLWLIPLAAGISSVAKLASIAMALAFRG
jgi:hypothetical protein